MINFSGGLEAHGGVEMVEEGRWGWWCCLEEPDAGLKPLPGCYQLVSHLEMWPEASSEKMLLLNQRRSRATTDPSF